MAQEIVDFRTSHKALEVLYNDGYKDESHTFLERVAHKLWNNTNNAKGVRNRLLITEGMIEDHILSLLHDDKVRTIHMLSIASGSARAYVTVLNRLELPDNVSFKITFLDKNQEALEYSKKLIKQMPPKAQVRAKWIEDTANAYLNATKNQGKEFHIVEMVGLMDYFSDDKVVKTMKSIRKRLAKNGCLVTANVIPNKEQLFLSKVVGWRMIYRTPEQFTQLITQAGYTNRKIDVVVEPMLVHTIVKVLK
jgi:hypothetical protein